MWILSSEGDFLQDKRIWLKPGKKYLFGRVKSDGVCHAIDHKSISRQHLVVEVGHVEPGDGSRIHVKSKLVLSDQSSKGTTIDGESIHGKSKELVNRDQYTIKLGRYPRALKIEWCPIVLSFSLPSKELKAKDPLAHARSRLEDLDIKTVLPYVSGKTTHVVQNKRNTSKGLQALVNGKYIVQKSYIEAIVYAATPSELENEEALSPLEEDFDSSWPHPPAHLPARGKEPTQLPETAYEPDTDRLNVFDGYTFIFCDSGRFEELQGPITSGHGKALLYEVEVGKTTAEDIVDYVRKAAGNKGFAHEYDGSGGVILVQFQGERGQEHWAQETQQQVSQLTGQKILEPSEFLDAVLRNNASNLCQPISKDKPSSENQNLAATLNNGTPGDHARANRPPDEWQSMEGSTGPGGPTSANANSAISENNQDASRPLKRSRARTYVPKFKTFDDGFDMDSIPAYTLEQGGEEATQEATQPLSMETIPATSQQNHSLSDEDNMVTELLPGAAAMKQLPMGGKRRRDPTPPPEPQKKPKRTKLDVKEAARQRREAVDEASTARREEDAASFQAVAEGMDLTQLRKAIVEEMPVGPRASERQSNADVSGDPRWDERWNGRKNFKKFRRKGHADAAAQHRIQTVIVPVEEVKRRDVGLGDGYFSASRPASGTHRAGADASSESPQTSQVPSQPRDPAPSSRTRKRSRDPSDSDDDGLRFRFRRKKR